MPIDATADRGRESHAPIDPDAFYTLGEAARLSGFGPDVLRARCDAGVLPCQRAAGVARSHRRVKGADLLAFLGASGRRAAVEAKPGRAVRRGNTFKADELAALKKLGLA